MISLSVSHNTHSPPTTKTFPLHISLTFNDGLKLTTLPRLCPMLNGTMKTEDAANGNGSFGAVAAPLSL
nr:hypothetical protein CFP56_22346 [Quercus suber]